jgi:hypothetical protein
MNKLTNTANPNTSFITGGKIDSGANKYQSLTFEDSLSGQKLLTPVSVQIRNFIKNEFAKIKK